MSRTTIAVQKTELAGSRERRPIEGLCRTCSKGEVCTFPRDPSRPIWSCDEFEGLAFSPPAPLGARPPLSLVREDPAEPMDLKGLCKQCENRFTCIYPKPLGGVWHCDELA